MKKTLFIACWALFALAGSTFASGEVMTGTISTGHVSTGSHATWTVQNPKNTQTDAEKKAVLVCIKTAALTREWYLQSTYRKFTDAIMISYLRRSEWIQAAYETTTSIKDARPLIKTVFDTWKETVKKAREAFKKARKEVRDTFKTNVTACRPDNATWKDATWDSTGQEKSEWGAL
jgi:hypothetical protein